MSSPHPVEPWIEAIISGHKLPRAFELDELERYLQEALENWQDEARLAESPLLQSTVVARSPGGEPAGPAALREAILRGVETGRSNCRPDQALEYRALELAYLQKSGSYDRAAEQLAVSRATFYRLLKRGVKRLAQVIYRTP